MNNFINLNLENIENEHICCAIGDKKHQNGVKNKKDWLKERIKEGHIFRKLDAQGKIFIEFAPLEFAWVPICGDNFLYIYCLWVAGSYKGNGYAKELLEYSINEAKKQNKNGICVISSKKKKPFLSEKSFFEKFGFKVVDSIEDFELLSLNFKENSPKFNDSTRKMTIENKDFNIFYSPQCPYVLNCIKEIQEFAKESGKQIIINEINSLEKAKNAPCIFNNWANFYNGKFISNTLLNKNSISKMLK